MMNEIPTVIPRRLLDDDGENPLIQTGSYLESDRDFLENNRHAAVWLLENAHRLQLKPGDTMSKRVLVVWNEIPENVYLVPLEVSDEESETLSSFHGRYINNDYHAAVITDYFYDEDGNFKFDRTKGPLTNKQFDLTIVTGIVL